jgi:hypothetical protein
MFWGSDDQSSSIIEIDFYCINIYPTFTYFASGNRKPEISTVALQLSVYIIQQYFLSVNKVLDIQLLSFPPSLVTAR